MNKYPRVFRVTNGKKEGTCYSWHDHFDVMFDDGEYIGTHELSLYNIQKTNNELSSETKVNVPFDFKCQHVHEE